LFELVIRCDNNARFQQIFLLHPELEEYFTQDLFEKHSTKQGLWRYSGWKDDMVLLASGDLLLATEMEQVIIRHLEVHWALIRGD
jgi:ADP-glucose pyrophosphorylase